MDDESDKSSELEELHPSQLHANPRALLSPFIMMLGIADLALLRALFTTYTGSNTYTALELGVGFVILLVMHMCLVLWYRYEKVKLNFWFTNQALYSKTLRGKEIRIPWEEIMNIKSSLGGKRIIAKTDSTIVFLKYFKNSEDLIAYMKLKLPRELSSKL